MVKITYNPDNTGEVVDTDPLNEGNAEDAMFIDVLRDVARKTLNDNEYAKLPDWMKTERR